MQDSHSLRCGIQESNDLFLRARDLDSMHPDLILSLHHDGVQDQYLRRGMIDGVYREYSDKFAGYSLFVSYDNPDRDDSVLFAKLLGEELTSRHHKFTMHHAEKIPGENRPVVDGNVGVFRYDKLVVLRRVHEPAVLMENAVIINPDDEALAQQPDYQKQIAESVIAALGHYCALRPRPVARPVPETKRRVPAVQSRPGAQTTPQTESTTHTPPDQPKPATENPPVQPKSAVEAPPVQAAPKVGASPAEAPTAPRPETEQPPATDQYR
jgi:hypothetical protein